MLGTQITKENFDAKLYTKCARYCNENDLRIEDKGDYYEVVEPVYDLTAEKESKKQQLYCEYLRELKTIADPTELQACMTLADSDELIDVIDTDGTPRQYTSDEFTTLLNDSLTKRNELLQRYKDAYKKIKNAKKVDTVREVTL